nr:MAG TPA: hypothetical protein [Caudoviricetes sp.]DAH09339.1 MAG TPA: hypothetical protein [Caudoviricetes sp.]DAI97150.1 MAG TPA: hypothetical protein [Caudoviricetes sp.]DAM25640.1 MAG TPA: hypothetical protein [Caudoviricetes sp.]DAU95012.1 MAG TPA: hypothetical protein [Caudoviricetes sp.]
MNKQFAIVTKGQFVRSLLIAKNSSINLWNSY